MLKISFLSIYGGLGSKQCYMWIRKTQKANSIVLNKLEVLDFLKIECEQWKLWTVIPWISRAVCTSIKNITEVGLVYEILYHVWASIMTSLAACTILDFKMKEHLKKLEKTFFNPNQKLFTISSRWHKNAIKNSSSSVSAQQFFKTSFKILRSAEKKSHLD